MPEKLEDVANQATRQCDCNQKDPLCPLYGVGNNGQGAADESRLQIENRLQRSGIPQEAQTEAKSLKNGLNC